MCSDLIGAAHVDHFRRQFFDGEFGRIAQIDWVMKIIGIHQSDKPVDQIVHIAKRTSLIPRAIEGQRSPRRA